MPIDKDKKFMKKTEDLKSFKDLRLKVSENKLINVINDRLEEIRKVDNPARNHEAYLRYVRGCNLINDFVSTNDRGYAYIDDADSVGRFHCATLFVTDGDFESNDEIELFCQILECFDSMTLSYNDGKILIALLVEDIYVNKKAIRQ